ncbi:hypothetical protein C1X64_13635 [Pseudomonas sp. GW456-E7]|nr:hypothetical protein C1X64_13635 [Pseudomonas sp. GW456-E7]
MTMADFWVSVCHPIRLKHTERSDRPERLPGMADHKYLTHLGLTPGKRYRRLLAWRKGDRAEGELMLRPAFRWYLERCLIKSRA